MPWVAPMQLRDYQIEFLDRLYQAIRNGATKIACVAPTGSGKTVLMAQIAQHIVQGNCRVLILVHLDVLVGQTYDKLQQFGLAAKCGFIKAGWPEEREAPVQIASIQTMSKRQWWRSWPADVVIYDEAHQTLFAKVGQTIRYETHPHAIILAFTATPYRLSEREGLGDHLDTLIAAPTPAELQRLGMLAPMRYFGLPMADQIDLAGVRTIAGDYAESDLKNACDRPALIQRIVEEWQRLTPGKRTIAFCVDITHAEHVAAAFQTVGVPAAMVSGEMPVADRQPLYEALGRGELLVLTSCNVISIGFDRPEVEVGLLLRPTQSLALHHQQIGRVMRMAPGKTCGTILDQAGNLLRLGFPEDLDAYTLTCGETTSGESIIPKRQCPQCNWVCHAALPRCPACGFQFPNLATAVINEADLVEVLSQYEREASPAIRQQIHHYRQLRQRGYQQGQDPTWAALQFRHTFGVLPKRSWSKGAIFGHTPTQRDYETYLAHLKQMAIAQGKHYSWVHQEFLDEFGSDASHWIAARMQTTVKPALATAQRSGYGPAGYPALR
ncbi:DEAD/DEAH box helicase [Trichothermofontia sp.]